MPTQHAAGTPLLPYVENTCNVSVLQQLIEL